MKRLLLIPLLFLSVSAFACMESRKQCEVHVNPEARATCIEAVHKIILERLCEEEGKCDLTEKDLYDRGE